MQSYQSSLKIDIQEGKPHVPDFLHLHAVKEKYSCNFAN